MLSALDVALLQSARSYPSISLFVNRTWSAHTDGARLGALVGTARARLRREESPGLDASLGPALERAAADAELGPGAAALGVFVNAEITHQVPLPLPVEERVVIDDTFATRDLVRALQRSPHAWALVLDERVTRLYECRGPIVNQVHGAGFPLVRDRPADPDPPPGRRREHARRDADARRYTADVDEALAPHLARDPGAIFLLGAARRVAAFRERSAHRGQIAGWAPVVPPDTADLTVGRLVAPLAGERTRAAQQAALDELDSYAGGRCADGLEAAWRHAEDGRGELLVVEEGFSEAAVIVDGRLHPAADPEHPAATDDVIDDLVEAVLAGQGRAVFVPDGSLAGRGRVALRLRW